MADGNVTRRSIITAGLSAAIAAFLAACSGGKTKAISTPPGASKTPAPTPSRSITQATLTPTPSCTDGDEITPAQTEGPYFTPESPEKTNFAGDVRAGEKLALSGTVVSTTCAPIAHALVDFWHCDDGGNYDNSGYRLRGHQFTDAKGTWKLDTILPGVYPGRTRHIHVKVQAPNKPVLTTQLYFPGEAGNASDGIFRSECLITMREVSDGKAGTFAFVLDV